MIYSVFNAILTTCIAKFMFNDIPHNLGLVGIPQTVNTDTVLTQVAGHCYHDAWRFLIREEEGELIHGSVISRGKRTNHAWVETETGYIWEPESGEFFSLEVFKTFKPIEDARYSVEEAAIMVTRSGHSGPWR